MLEFEEFVWLLGALAAQANAEAGGGGALSLKSVEELKADRLREEQQVALQLRGNTLRLKVDALTKASQVLHLERPLVCAQLLLRLHLAELAEAAALTTHETGGGKNAALELMRGPAASTATGSGVLRGSAALLTRRADVIFRALTALAVEERPRALKHMRQAMASPRTRTLTLTLTLILILTLILTLPTAH